MASRSYRGVAPRARGDFSLERDVFVANRMAPPVLAILREVQDSVAAPYAGITSDGNVQPGLFSLTGGPEVDVATMVAAGSDYLSSLSPTERTEGRLPIDASEWRLWTNAYPIWKPHGLLLADLSYAQRDAALGLMRASLSAEGYERTRTVMLFNQILGELIDDYRETLQEWMYRFTVFGSPCSNAPWGWQLAGHHLDLHCVVVDGHMVLTPAFMGAEPVTADDGPWRGARLFEDEAHRALELMNALTPSHREQATIFPSMRTEDLPPELKHRTEGRMRAGAGADNLLLPYQGLAVGSLGTEIQELVVQLVKSYVDIGPTRQASNRIAAVRRHLEDTHFSWIGGHGVGDAFYYRIHSPVILIEFDHHPGVFLSNTDPANFHAHCVVRTPNGNDYGKDLLRQHYSRHEHGRSHSHSHTHTNEGN